MKFSLKEIVHSGGYKQFMSKLYGWGAAAVITGALFKIQHYPGASLMLNVGLGTEALIFFMSAFEPLHAEYDWALVYPELSGLEEELESKEKEKPIDTKKSALERFDEMLNKAEISPELFERLGTGLNKLNQTTSQISDISDASIATNEYVANVKAAFNSAGELSNSYAESSETIKQSAGNLSESYMKTADAISKSGQDLSEQITKSGTNLAEQVTKSGNELSNQISKSGNNLAASYGRLTESMNSSYEAITDGNKSYSEQLETLNKNLSALNAVHELQLQGSNEHLKASEELYSGLDQMMENLRNSAEDTKKYREEVSKLGKNLAALNTVYGNMLSAMNINQ